MEGESMSEWKEVRLGDVGKIVGGATPSTRNPHNYGGVIPWITPKDLSINKERFIEFGERNISEQGLNSCSAKMLPKGSILFSSRAPIGYVAIAHTSLCTNQGFKSFVPDTEKMDSMFSYYLLKHNSENIANLGSGTTFMEVSGKVMSDYIVNIPDLFTQQEIAGILSSLDAKIETNNKLNEKLEEMAQAIFKSWFVDFEPFKDKPFHETGLGMIPEGWEVSTFSSIIEKFISGDWGKETPTGNYVHKVACIRGCDFENIKNGLRGKTPERFILERNFASKQPKPNDIVVEMSGGTATVSTGRICYITKELLDQYGGDIVCTNFCKIVRPLKGWSQYLYYYWQYKYDKKVMFCYENGTSGIKNFAINDFIDIESLLIPPKDELIKFNSIIDNIRVKIQMNGVENTRLASLRDTLLPRLMSGELIV